MNGPTQTKLEILTVSRISGRGRGEGMGSRRGEDVRREGTSVGTGCEWKDVSEGNVSVSEGM